MTVGERIKRIRQEKGLSQKQLGEKLGVSQQMIGQYESPNANLKLETIKKITAALEVPMSFFLDDEFFNAVTGPDAEYESQLIDDKFKAITENEELSANEKEDLLNDLVLKAEIMANMHASNAEMAGKVLLNKYFDMLNFTGQEKAIEHLEMLTKISEYTEPDDK